MSASNRSSGSGWPLGLSLVMAVMGLAASEALVQVHIDQQERERHERHLNMTSQLRSRLESSLNSTVFLAHGLVAYVASVRQPTPEQAERALRALYESDRRIRNVGLAPDNVIRYVYPRETNERALGLNYADLPEQWPDIRKIMDTRQSVLSGPITLVQGGRALVSRAPVFLDDGRYWGAVSTVIDIDRLVQDIDLPLSGEVRFALYGPGPADTAARIFGEPAGESERSLRMNIEVPGHVWTLVATPVALTGQPVGAWMLRAVMGSMSLMLGLFVFMSLSDRARAQALAERLAQVNRGLAVANEELLRLAQRDPLTTLLNRRAFEQAFQSVWRDAQRRQVSLAVLMIDIDHFKDINDRHGHAAGDEALRLVADAIQGQVRRHNDVVARYGGEEFVVLAMGLDEKGVADCAERIRNAVIGCDGRVGEASLSLTVSIGAAFHVPQAEDRPADLLRRADALLYQAKRAGRNRSIAGETLSARRAPEAVVAA